VDGQHKKPSLIGKKTSQKRGLSWEEKETSGGRGKKSCDGEKFRVSGKLLKKKRGEVKRVKTTVSSQLRHQESPSEG